MCVIITKTKEQTKPTQEFLQKAWNTNPDGAGYMYVKDNKIIIEKGFMKFKDFWKKAKDLPEDSAIVYHFRIATHGARNYKGTHPFPITSKDKDLQKSHFVTNIGVAHNGIIRLTSSYDKKENPYDLSDTQLFIRDYLTVIQKIPNWNKTERVLNIIDNLIGSKMAFLNNDNTITYVGDFTDVEGYKCSNNYFNFTSKKSYSDYGKSYNYYNYDYYDYDYDYDYDITKFKTVTKTPRKLVPESLNGIVFIKDKKDMQWYDISDFNTVEMNTYSSIYLDDKYEPNVELVDFYGIAITYSELLTLMIKYADEKEVEV